MNEKNLFLSIIILFLIIIFRTVSFSEILLKENINITNDEKCVEFASDVIEKYYRNKDIDEINDFSNQVSKSAMNLLNTKIDLEHLKKKYFNLKYKDYKIEIMPYEVEKWCEKDNKIFMIFQVKKSWLYNSNTEKTTVSEIQEITLHRGLNNSLEVLTCYEKYENMTLSPIDQIYKNAITSKSNKEKLLEDYKTNFENQCIQKSKKMILESKIYLEESIRTWVRDNKIIMQILMYLIAF